MSDVHCGGFQQEYEHSNRCYNDVKEELSKSYLSTICAYIGAVLENKSRIMDNRGIDATVELPPGEGRPAPLRLDIQLKCTSSPDIDHDAGHLIFNLKKSVYERMSFGLKTSPWLLFILILPETVSDWIRVDEKELIERGTMLWCEVKECCVSIGDEYARLAIPLSNRVTEKSLHYMLIKQMEDEI